MLNNHIVCVLVSSYESSKVPGFIHKLVVEAESGVALALANSHTYIDDIRRPGSHGYLNHKYLHSIYISEPCYSMAGSHLVTVSLVLELVLLLPLPVAVGGAAGHTAVSSVRVYLLMRTYSALPQARTFPQAAAAAEAVDR